MNDAMHSLPAPFANNSHTVVVKTQDGRFVRFGKYPTKREAQTIADHAERMPEIASTALIAHVEVA